MIPSPYASYKQLAPGRFSFANAHRANDSRFALQRLYPNCTTVPHRYRRSSRELLNAPDYLSSVPQSKGNKG